MKPWMPQWMKKWWPEKTQTWGAYRWKGLNLRTQIIEYGEVEALSLEAATTLIRQQEILLLKISKSIPPAFKFLQRSISSKKITEFCQKLLALIQAQISLNQSFELLIQTETHPDMLRLYKALKNKIESGFSLSEALKDHPQYFEPFFYHLIYLGEQSARLEGILSQITANRKKKQDLHDSIKEALIYPCFVLVLSIMVTILMMIFVLPQFADIFKNFKTELPLATQTVLALSQRIRHQGHWYLMFILASIFAFKKAKSMNIPFKHYIDGQILKLPFLGIILHDLFIMSWSEYLALTQSSGLSLIRALNLIEPLIKNSHHRQAIESIQEAILNGESMYFAVTKTALFGPVTQEFIRIGEETGDLVKMLDYLTQYHQSRLEQMVRKLSSLLEPILMTLIGLILGALMIAIYLPISELGSLV